MGIPDIKLATNEEREWAANLFANSDPWIKLGVSLELCKKNCNDPEYLVYIAHIENKLCGVMILVTRGFAGSPYLKSIAVAPEFRSAGIGAYLLEFAENLFRGNAKHFFLCVSSFNTKARSFYDRHGYEAVGELKDYIVEGFSEIIMHKKL